jgi:hypothetical protein
MKVSFVKALRFKLFVWFVVSLIFLSSSCQYATELQHHPFHHSTDVIAAPTLRQPRLQHTETYKTHVSDARAGEEVQQNGHIVIRGQRASFA